MQPTTTTTTGRWIVVFAQADVDHASLRQALPGVASIADSRDFTSGGLDLEQTAAADATLFGELGMAVVRAEGAAPPGLRDGGSAPVLSVSPELVHHLLAGPDPSYVQGYRDGVHDLSRRLGAGPRDSGSRPDPAPGFADTAEATWGVQATRAAASPRSGRGIRVAVLDTGIDLAHPDFAGRNVTTSSFVPGEPVQDEQGHGTHCTGTACGPLAPVDGPRYGVAHEADVVVGKVLSNAGSGSDAGILAGIDWAVARGCEVVSLSLGADVPSVHPPYTTAGRRALDRGSLLVAAAGNNADRPRGRSGFVGPPASSPYVLAVGALDAALEVPDFSARSLAATRGGQVDLAAPGEHVRSCWPMPVRYRSISGTSMAAPHVAGVAALWAEQTGLRGRDLWAVLCMESDRLLAASADVGAGLVLAPP